MIQQHQVEMDCSELRSLTPQSKRKDCSWRYCGPIIPMGMLTGYPAG